jgi:hypothetical protein
VVADCDGEVDKNNEGDNVMSDPGLACSQPDLNFFAPLSCSSGHETAKAGTAMTISGEVRGATGALRDFKVSAWLKGKAMRASKIFEQDFNDPGMLVVPFSFSWTPSSIGAYSIQVEAELGPHAVGAGVVDATPGNNSVSFKVNVIAATPILKH